MLLAAIVPDYVEFVLFSLAVGITAAGGAVSGYRAHRWLDDRGVRLPPDSGAWLGVLASLLVLFAGSGFL